MLRPPAPASIRCPSLVDFAQPPDKAQRTLSRSRQSDHLVRVRIHVRCAARPRHLSSRHHDGHPCRGPLGGGPPRQQLTRSNDLRTSRQRPVQRPCFHERGHPTCCRHDRVGSPNLVRAFGWGIAPPVTAHHAQLARPVVNHRASRLRRHRLDIRIHRPDKRPSHSQQRRALLLMCHSYEPVCEH